MDVQSLCGRVDQLETQNRRLKRIGGVVAFGAIIGLIIGQTVLQDPTPAPYVIKSGMIEAQAFVVTDKNGEKKAILGTDGETTQLTFLQGDDVRFHLTSDKNTTVLTLSAGSSIALATEDDKVRILLGDENNKTRAALAFSEETGSFLALKDRYETNRVGLALQKGSGPVIHICDNTGSPVYFQTEYGSKDDRMISVRRMIKDDR